MSKVLLKNICKPNEIGKYGIPASAEDYDESKVRYLRISDIDDFGKLLDKDKKSVSATDINKYILEENDIVVARTGNSTGRTYFHEKKNGILAFAGFLIKYGLDNNKVNPKYLKYYTISSEYKQWVKNLSVGSTRGNINAQTFANCPILLPERKQQNFLVSILSLLDDKIELNNRINDNLERIAKTLYDYWFVQFNFPDENGKPYKSTGGKMVWNEVLKRNIPEGWEYTELSDALTIKYGKDHKKLNEGSIPVYGSGGIMKYVDTSIYDKEAILIPRKGSIGNLFYVAEPFWSVDTMFFAIPLVQGSTLYYFHQLSKLKLETLNVGTAVPSLTTEVLNRIKLLVSDSDIMLKFNSFAFKNQNQISLLNKQNQKLSSLRDWLLPMLMNGQVKVE